MIAPILKPLGPALTPMPSIKFDSHAGERALKARYGVTSLDGFGQFSRAELSAAGALISYLEVDSEREAACAVAAFAHCLHRIHEHRRGHAPQSRTHRNAEWRAQRQPAVHHRLDRDSGPGARELASRLPRRR